MEVEFTCGTYDSKLSQGYFMFVFDFYINIASTKINHEFRMLMSLQSFTTSPSSSSSSRSSSNTCGSLSLLEKATWACSLRSMSLSGATSSSIYWMWHFSLGCAIPAGKLGSLGYRTAIASALTYGMWLVALLMLSPTSSF